MDKAILYYPIGEATPESPTLETLKHLISTEATRLDCAGGSDWMLRVYINSYRLAKEDYHA